MAHLHGARSLEHLGVVINDGRYQTRHGLLTRGFSNGVEVYPVATLCRANQVRRGPSVLEHFSTLLSVLATRTQDVTKREVEKQIMQLITDIYLSPGSV